MSTGGPGRCTGLGSPIAPWRRYHRPSKSKGSVSVQSRRVMVSASPRAAIASGVGTSSTPYASNSRRTMARTAGSRVRVRLPPTPTPKISRPPEMMSTVAAILASRVGRRRRLSVTITPSRNRVV